MVSDKRKWEKIAYWCVLELLENENKAKKKKEF
jgi:hypothetical protein